MLRVYNYMAAGLAITGVAAYGTFQAAVDATGNLTPLRRDAVHQPAEVGGDLRPASSLSWCCRSASTG